MAGFWGALGSAGAGFAPAYTNALAEAAKQLQVQQQQQAQTDAGQIMQQMYPAPGGAASGQPALGSGIFGQILSKLSQPQQNAQPAAQPQGGQGQQPGFQGALNFTLGQEGGYNPSDSNGAPSNYGINQAANPDVNVATLTPQTAGQIYKTKYWDAIDGDNIPPPMQKMVFDTAVMSSPETAKKMYQAAKGDPSTFMQIRQAFQSKLLQTDPQKYQKYAAAWDKRNKALLAGIQQPGAIPGGPQGAGGAGGGAVHAMTLPDIIQAARARNPNLPPDRLFRAVGEMLPMMNAQAQQDYRQVLLGLRAQGQQNLQDYRGQSLDLRQQGQDTRAEALTEKKNEFQERQARLGEQFDERLTQNEEKIKNSKDQAERNFQYREGRDLIRDNLAARRNEIYASSAAIADPNEQQKLLKQAAADAEAAGKRLDDAFKAARTAPSGGKPPTASAKPPAGAAASSKAPVRVKTPAEAASLTAGTHYVTPDGTEYVR